MAVLAHMGDPIFATAAGRRLVYDDFRRLGGGAPGIQGKHKGGKQCQLEFVIAHLIHPLSVLPFQRVGFEPF